MHHLFNIIIGIGLAISSFFAPSHLFGTTVTTINGTDTISGSRTTLNNNFSALLAGKVEVSDLAATTSLQQLTTLTGLTTVGTITSGTWHGSTLTVPFGGTGSSTLSQYQVLLGNGTGAITTPVGWGTSGQSLVSNGAGVLPSWQSTSFDNSLNYTNTGTWTFNTGGIIDTASSTFNGRVNIAATDTSTHSLAVNGIAYKFPSVQVASTTYLATDGSGSLTWETASTTITQVTATFSQPTSSGGNASGSATCSSGATVVGGGFSGVSDSASNGGAEEMVTTDGPSASNAWNVALHCSSGTSCNSATVTVYAICLNKTP